MTTIFRYAGFSEEDEFAETPAPAAAFHLDIMSASLDAPSDTQIQFEGSVGRGRKMHRPGFYSPSGNTVVAVDVNTIGWFLKWAIGQYAFTAGSNDDPNVHEMYRTDSNVLTPFTTRIGKDHFEHVFHGCGINTLSLQVNDGFCQLTVDVMSQKDSSAALQTIDNLLLPEAFPLMFHEVTATREGTDVSAQVKSFTLEIANNLDAAAGRSIGSRYPRRLVANAFNVSVSAELFYQDKSELERYWGGANGPAATGSEEFGMTFVFDAGDDGQLEIAVPRVIYGNVDTQPSGRTETAQPVTMQAYEATHTLADGVTEIASEILATVSNNVAELSAS